MLRVKYFDNENNQNSIEIDKFPEECPECKKAAHFNLVTAYGIHSPYGDSLKIQAVLRCPREKCQKMFFAFYTDPYRLPRRMGGGEKLYLQRWGFIGIMDPIEFSEPIPKISKKFTRIYNQASIAEENGLDEICGVGYGKALEFLIKDYLIHIDKSQKEQIKKEHRLGILIEKIPDKNIQIVAKRAAWLRNDETHYERVWKTQDVQNLKDLIDLTVHHIKASEMTKRYTKKMPDPKEKKENQAKA